MHASGGVLPRRQDLPANAFYFGKLDLKLAQGFYSDRQKNESWFHAFQKLYGYEWRMKMPAFQALERVESKLRALDFEWADLAPIFDCSLGSDTLKVKDNLTRNPMLFYFRDDHYGRHLNINHSKI